MPPVKRALRAGVLGTATALAGLLALAGCGSGKDTDASPKTPRGTTGAPAPSSKPKPSRTADEPSADSGKRSSGSPEPTRGSDPKPTAVELPPLHAGFDYQIGGAYPPAPGVRIVSRDRSSSPAPGLYNICYVNAFQAQPEERGQWPADLLLRDADGKVVVDKDWDEALLDISTPDKRRRVAARVDRWIDACADKGFDAIEPDNYDSYTRSRKLLTADDATAFISLLSARAHARHLAIGQKNTVELSGARSRAGLDFAVAEECGEYDECGEYAKAFHDRVVVIEYTDSGLRKARAAYGNRLSIVRRDVLVSTPGNADYVRRTR
ncbi:endo alpha-1,4 polygalactosaminidase [Streptomyces sp. NBC_00687]|uniref:endo alpha-1,4 polygalactosaminidase n=1 Tax=Streptomyces sp. NBC_00687 TaxID=2975807 RepID=UPI002251A027|nr:endo alpha-1,4 polygalactosaminidase [Streptomyces sp. NBC_00687]MCX4918475.1 endo alpha-1,4 polygalactosaminidase [Streptomyces sp. NBC_00687]